MRLPIVEFPQIVSENLAHFAPVFATREQLKHFCEYVTGLIAGDKATVTAINDLFVNQNDQSALNKFLTQASWDEQELNRRRVQSVSLLGDQGSSGRSRWNVRGQFLSTGQRCQAVVDELLSHLVSWLARQLEQGVNQQTILQRLLA